MPSVHDLKVSVPSTWEDDSVYRFLLAADSHDWSPQLRGGVAKPLRFRSNVIVSRVALPGGQAPKEYLEEGVRKQAAGDPSLRVLDAGLAELDGRTGYFQDTTFAVRAGEGRVMVFQRQVVFPAHTQKCVSFVFTHTGRDLSTALTEMGMVFGRAEKQGSSSAPGDIPRG